MESKTFFDIGDCTSTCGANPGDTTCKVTSQTNPEQGDEIRDACCPAGTYCAIDKDAFFYFDNKWLPCTVRQCDKKFGFTDLGDGKCAFTCAEENACGVTCCDPSLNERCVSGSNGGAPKCEKRLYNQPDTNDFGQVTSSNSGGRPVITPTGANAARYSAEPHAPATTHGADYDPDNYWGSFDSGMAYGTPA